MPNGAQGDHPITDITIHGMSVFSPEIDELVRKVDQFGGFASELAALYMLHMQNELEDARGRRDEDAEARLLHWLRAVLLGEVERLAQRRS